MSRGDRLPAASPSREPDGILLGAVAALATIAFLGAAVVLTVRVPATVPPLVLALAAATAGWFRAAITGRGGRAAAVTAVTGLLATIAATVAALLAGAPGADLALVAGLVTAEVTVAAAGLLAQRDARRRAALALAALLGAPLVAAGALLAVSLGASERHGAGLLFLLLSALAGVYLPVKASELGGRLAG